MTERTAATDGGVTGAVLTVGHDAVSSCSTVVTWQPGSRVALVGYRTGTSLRQQDGTFLVDALTARIGAGGEPFAILADCAGLAGTDAEYRSKVGDFFRQHRHDACIALTHLGPVIHVVVEMFRVGTGIQLKAFAGEAAARSWLRTRGIAA